MDKGTILKQLKSVDNPSFFTLGNCKRFTGTTNRR